MQDGLLTFCCANAFADCVSCVRDAGNAQGCRTRRLLSPDHDEACSCATRCRCCTAAPSSLAARRRAAVVAAAGLARPSWMLLCFRTRPQRVRWLRSVRARAHSACRRRALLWAALWTPSADALGRMRWFLAHQACPWAPTGSTRGLGTPTDIMVRPLCLVYRCCPKLGRPLANSVGGCACG